MDTLVYLTVLKLPKIEELEKRRKNQDKTFFKNFINHISVKTIERHTPVKS